MIFLDLTAVDHPDQLIRRYASLGTFIDDQNSVSCVYHYQPKTIDEALSCHELLNIAIFLSLNSQFDFILVNNSFEDYPVTTRKNLQDAIVYRNEEGKRGIGSGRELRLLPERSASRPYDISGSVVGHADPDNMMIAKPEPNRIPNSTKPLVFVWPIFLAMGGVERNTIEIMKVLKSKYDFVVISMERIGPSLGSLHHDFLEHSVALIDLCELFPQQVYLDALGFLKEVFSPSLIWICNGNPWLQENARKIRILFHDAAIVDQEVYDTGEGWINGYESPGIQSFNRFIAVTEKIHRVFLEEKGMDDSRIDVIYSAVKQMPLISNLSKRRDDFFSKYGIKSTLNTFTFAARIVEQKNPLLFVQLAHVYPQYQFVMVGEGILEDVVNDKAQELGLSNFIRIPFIPGLEEVYSISDGMIVTSIYEGLPIAMIEAMCLGLPVFSTAVGDAENILAKFKLGKVYSAEDEAQFVKDFGCWADDISQHKEISLKASEDVRLFFSSETLATKYISTFEQAIADCGNYKGSFLRRLMNRFLPSR